MIYEYRNGEHEHVDQSRFEWEAYEIAARISLTDYTTTRLVDLNHVTHAVFCNGQRVWHALETVPVELTELCYNAVCDYAPHGVPHPIYLHDGAQI